MNKKKIFVKLLVEAKKLSDMGATDQEIDEGFMDLFGQIGHSGGVGIIETFKKYVFKFFVSKFGVDPNSFMGLVLSNAFANLSFTDYKKVFRDCEFTSNLVAESLIDTLIEQMRGKVGLDSVTYSVLQDALVDAFKTQSTVQTIAEKIHGPICDIVGEAREKLTSQIPGIDKII